MWDMHIAINATILDDKPSGLGVYTVNLIRELSTLTRNLSVFTAKPEYFQAMNGINVYDVTRKVTKQIGSINHLRRMLWTQFALPFNLKCDDIYISPTQLELVLFPNNQEIAIIHDILPLMFPDEYPRLQYFFRYVLPIGLRNSTAIVVDSKNTGDDIIKLYGVRPSKIHLVPPGFDSTIYKPQQYESINIIKNKYGIGDYILYVGNLYPHKNLKRLLEAFSIIQSSIPHKLIIVGYKDNRYYPAINRDVVQMGIEHRVLFLDYISADELPILYAGASLFVFPSLYEGFGLPPLEAMASGTPVACSNTSSLPEVVGDAALLFDPCSIEEMANAMRKVLSDSTLRDELRDRGLERSKLFSWNKTAKGIMDIVNSIK